MYYNICYTNYKKQETYICASILRQQNKTFSKNSNISHIFCIKNLPNSRNSKKNFRKMKLYYIVFNLNSIHTHTHSPKLS